MNSVRFSRCAPPATPGVCSASPTPNATLDSCTGDTRHPHLLPLMLAEKKMRVPHFSRFSKSGPPGCVPLRDVAHPARMKHERLRQVQHPPCTPSSASAECATFGISPGGANQRSPALQRWETWENDSSPGGTTEYPHRLFSAGKSRSDPQVPKGRPSLKHTPNPGMDPTSSTRSGKTQVPYQGIASAIPQRLQSQKPLQGLDIENTDLLPTLQPPTQLAPKWSRKT